MLAASERCWHARELDRVERAASRSAVAEASTLGKNELLLAGMVEDSVGVIVMS